VKTIILSAGQGRRLLPLTEETPKSVLPIGNKSALGWQLAALEEAGATEVVVATGFHAEKIQTVVDEHNDKGGMPVRTSYNPFYANCDNLGTCWIVRHEMNQPFIIINGDTMFEPEVYRRLLAADDKYPITLVTNTKPAYDSDDMKVITAGNELKRVGKKLQAEHVSHESIGMIRFNQAGAARFVQKIESLMQHESTLARWYLSAVDELAADKLVGICDITGLGWCELDDMDDLAHANRVVPSWWERVAPLRKESAIKKA
jgi:choline kinase